MVVVGGYVSCDVVVVVVVVVVVAIVFVVCICFFDFVVIWTPTRWSLGFS